MPENIFNHRNGTFCTKYKISIQDDIVEVENKFFATTVKDPKMYRFIMHVENIPRLILSINKVFFISDGGYDSNEFQGNDDIIRVSIDTEFAIKELTVYGNRKGGPDRGQRIDFIFDPGEITYSPAKSRIPSPAMVWVMDTLQVIYDQWKKKKS